MECKLSFKKYDEALRQDKLLGLKCKQCGTINLPPRMVCGQCESLDMEIVELGGRGSIQTFSTVYVAPEGREAEVPYIIVMVSLDEGPWMIGNLVGVDPSKASMELIGKRVKLGHSVFSGDKYSAGDIARPIFRLEPSAG